MSGRPTYRKITKAAIGANLAIIFLEIIGFMLAFSYNGWSALIYYTQLSNLLALAAAILFVCSRMWQEQGHQYKKFDHFVYMLKYAAVVSVSLTFVVVVCILSWTTKFNLWQLLTQHSMLYHHTLCPILSVFSFLYLEEFDYKKKHIWAAISFTLLYAVVTIFLNIIGKLVGPYPFLMVYKQPWWMSIIWCVVILGGTCAIAALLRWGKKKIQAR